MSDLIAGFIVGWIAGNAWTALCFWGDIKRGFLAALEREIEDDESVPR